MEFSVGQLRSALTLAGLSKEEVKNISGKKALVEKIKEIGAEKYLTTSTDDETDEIFDNLVEESVDTKDLTVTSNASPKYASECWQEYVISKLKPDEYEEKNGKKFPKAAGLRRVVQELIGPIVESGPSISWSPNGESAIVVYKLKIGWFVGLSSWVKENLEKDDLQYRVFSEVADANNDNTPSPFNKYLVATASTRAEGRTLKKALALNITTAEEVGISSEEIEDTISLIQLNSFNILSDRLSIDKEKFIKYELGVALELSKIPKSSAMRLLEKLNEYQGNIDSIPEAIKS